MPLYVADQERCPGSLSRAGALLETRDAQTARSHTLAAMLQSAAIRFSRAEVEAITDGLTGPYNHRYLHELLDKADWAMYRAKGAGRNRVLAFGDDRVARETWLSRRGR